MRNWMVLLALLLTGCVGKGDNEFGRVLGSGVCVVTLSLICPNKKSKGSVVERKKREIGRRPTAAELKEISRLKLLIKGLNDKLGTEKALSDADIKAKARQIKELLDKKAELEKKREELRADIYNRDGMITNRNVFIKELEAQIAQGKLDIAKINSDNKMRMDAFSLSVLNEAKELDRVWNVAVAKLQSDKVAEINNLIEEHEALIATRSDSHERELALLREKIADGEAIIESNTLLARHINATASLVNLSKIHGINNRQIVRDGIAEFLNRESNRPLPLQKKLDSIVVGLLLLKTTPMPETDSSQATVVSNLDALIDAVEILGKVDGSMSMAKLVDRLAYSIGYVEQVFTTEASFLELGLLGELSALSSESNDLSE